MLLGNPRGPAVYRLRPGSGLDSYGDPVESWAVPERSRLRGAEVQAVSSSEEEGVARATLRDERVLFAPGAVDLTSADRVEVLGEVWRIDGDPVVRRGLASSVYTTANLRRFVGR